MNKAVLLFVCLFVCLFFRGGGWLIFLMLTDNTVYFHASKVCCIQHKKYNYGLYEVRRSGLNIQCTPDKWTTLVPSKIGPFIQLVNISDLT